MKKFLFVVVAILLLPVFASCEKDDNIDVNLLIGKWMMYMRMDEDGAEEVGPATGEEYYIEFKDGGVGVITVDGYDGNFTWTVSGTTLSVVGEYDYVGDMEMTIDKLTTDELFLMNSERYGGDVYRSYAYFRRVE